MSWQQPDRRVPCGLLIVAAAAGAWCLLPHGPARAALEAPEQLPPPSPAFGMVGSISCAAAACHNAGGPAGTKGSEYSTWITNDPHRLAGGVLYNNRSTRIERNLHGGRRSAWQDTLCLSCHVDPALANNPTGERAAGQNPVLADGVGCEGCHGPAERWLSEHYLPGWREKSPDEKAQLGMRAIGDLVVRSQTCAGCHVGEGDRDVNHDLIAAGHPSLRFELSAFHAALPKHWDEHAEKSRWPDLEARLWALGQASTAQSAVELLAHRASSRDRPWPEFAEYNCYSCHHGLESDSARRQGYAEAKGNLAERATVGGAAWGTWYLAMLPQALTDSGGPASGLPGDLQALRSEMAHAYPDRRRIAEQASACARTLAPIAARRARESFGGFESINRRLAEFARPPLPAVDWERAAQRYFALAALYHAQGDLAPNERDPELRPWLVEMSAEVDRPVSGRGEYNSAASARFAEALERFRQELRSRHLGNP